MAKLTYYSHTHHPGHPYRLELSDLSNSLMHVAAALYLLCSGCGCRASGHTYLCKLCNFALHAPCTRMPPLITHPGHEKHPLKLLTVPAYPSGRFICNGCRQQGSGFSYHCAKCRFNLRIVCESKRLRIHNQSHRHELHLAFNCPYKTRGFQCNVYGAMGGNQWWYRCSSCNFDVHLECAVVARARLAQVVAPEPQQASYAVAGQSAYISSGLNHEYQYQTHMFLGQSNMQGVIHNPYGMNIWSSQHQVQPAMRPSVMGFGLGAFSVAAAAEQGLVLGIAQQFGQSLARCVMDSGGGSDGGDGGGSIFDVSSFLDFS